MKSKFLDLAKITLGMIGIITTFGFCGGYENNSLSILSFVGCLIITASLLYTAYSLLKNLNIFLWNKLSE